MNGALIVTALFNGAWQGAALCGGAYLLFRFLRKLNASTMFTVWSVLLAICLALPVANYVFAARPYVAIETVAVRPAAAVVSHERRSSWNFSPERRSHAVVPQAIPVTQRAIGTVSAVLQKSPLILALLALVALVRLTLLARDLAGMVVARRASKRIDPPVRAALRIERPYAFASSSTLRSPCVLGFAPALIVIPDNLLDAPQERLLSVVLHEAEHVRRYDDVQNVVHRFIAALVFFCPGVHIALRELALYREQICDDAALDSLGDPVAYALTLTSMAQWAQGRGVPVPSFIFKRRQLVRRLEMLLDRAVNHSLKIDRRVAVSAGIALVLTAAIVLRFQVPVVAQEILRPPAPAAPKIAAPPALAKVAVSPALAKIAAPPALAKVAAPPALAKVAARPALAKVAAPPALAKAVRAVPQIVLVKTLAVHLAKMPALAPAPGAFAHAHAALRSAANAVAFAPPGPAVHALMQGRWSGNYSTDAMLNALEASGLRNLSVDQLIKLRDHGVGTALIVAAHNYYDGGLDVDSIVTFADHGIGAPYLQALGASGLPRLSASDVVRLYDNGVTATYIARIRAYNPRATVDDIIRLHNSGF